MGDGSLSQDEIDALLQGADDMLSSPGAAPAAEAAGGGVLSPVERDSLAETLNRSMLVAAPSLSAYLGKNLRIFNAVVEVKPHEMIRSEFGKQYVQVAMGYTGGLNGRNLILFNVNDAGVISSLMMGDESGKAPAELSEAHQSTIQEFVSQMLSSMATQFAEKLGKSVSATAPSLSMVRGAADLKLPPGGDLVKVTYNINIEGMVNSKFYHILEANMTSDMARGPQTGMAFQQSMPAQQPAAHPQMTQVGISPVKFPPLGEGIPSGASGNIGLLLDVPMTLTVELGRTRQLVKDILGLGEGSIIELDKLAGEPVDLLVNGKLIAKGEVVVIDENFGVRVTDIVSQAERISKIQ